MRRRAADQKPLADLVPRQTDGVRVELDARHLHPLTVRYVVPTTRSYLNAERRTGEHVRRNLRELTF